MPASAFERLSIPGRDCVGGDITRNADKLIREIATSIGSPFVSVRIQDVRNGREAAKLLAVVPLEASRIRADTRGFEFGVPDEQMFEVDRIIRNAEAA